MTDKIILDVSITYNAEDELKKKARDARGSTERVNPTAQTEQQEDETTGYGGLTQLDKNITGRDGIYVKRKKKVTGFGVGWIQQEATRYIPEYIFCMGCKFTVWCGNGSKSLDFTIDHIYDQSRFGSDLEFRVQSYKHDYCVLPVKDDRYILWIYSYKSQSVYQLADQHHLFLVNHRNIKQISKPTSLEFPDINDDERSAGFVSYRFPRTIISNEQPYTYDEITLHPQAKRLYTQDQYTFDCGHSDGATYGGFGFYELGGYSGEFTTQHIVGTGYIYNILLNRPMGSSSAPENSFARAGMESAPLRLSINSSTSIWGNYPTCTESDIVTGTNSSAPYQVKFTPDFAYGYGISPPQPREGYLIAFEMQAAVGNQALESSGTGTSNWWDNLSYYSLFYSEEEINALTWSPLKFSLPIHQPLNNQGVVWGLSVLNAGFTEDYYPTIKTRFWQILSNPWGRNWTAELKELGFAAQDLTFEPLPPST